MASRDNMTWQGVRLIQNILLYSSDSFFCFSWQSPTRSAANIKQNNQIIFEASSVGFQLSGITIPLLNTQLPDERNTLRDIDTENPQTLSFTTTSASGRLLATQTHTMNSVIFILFSIFFILISPLLRQWAPLRCSCQVERLFKEMTQQKRVENVQRSPFVDTHTHTRGSASGSKS